MLTQQTQLEITIRRLDHRTEWVFWRVSRPDGVLVLHCGPVSVRRDHGRWDIRIGRLLFFIRRKLIK